MSRRMLVLAVWQIQSVEIAGTYKVDQNKISTSGISSGGAMTTQMHVAYSAVFMGVGIVAGGCLLYTSPSPRDS